MWIDLGDKEHAPMIHEIKDSAGNPTDKQEIVILAFSLYSKEVCNGNVNEWRLSLTKANITRQNQHA